MSKTNVKVREGYRMTELGELPEDWRIVQIGESGDVVTGATPPTSEPAYWGGEVPFITPADLHGATIISVGRRITAEGVAKVRPVPQRAVAVGCIGHIGKVGMTNEPVSTTNQQINTVIPNRDLVDPWFLLYVVTHLAPMLESRARQTTVPILSKSNFAATCMLLPPLPEQKKIAAVLSTVQETKERTEAVIEAARELKKSLMKYLFTYGPVPVDEAEEVPLKQTEIGEIPEHWKVQRMGEIIAWGPQNGLYKPSSCYGAGSPIIRIDAFDEQGCFTSLDFKRLVLDLEEIKRYQVSPGDIIINRVNSLPQLGKAVLVPQLPEPTVFESNMMRLRVDLAQATPEFITSYLVTEPCRRRLSGMARQAVAQSSINQGDVRSLLVPLPPVPEQHAVADALACCDTKTEMERCRRRALDRLFRTLLRDLMTAEIRINDLEIEMNSETMLPDPMPKGSERCEG